MAGKGMHSQHTPLSPLDPPPGIITKTASKFKRNVLNQKYGRQLSTIVVRKSKECFLVILVKQYSNGSDLVLF